MQMGNGADVTRDGFGASGWLQVTGGDGFYERGDVNIKLGECIPVQADESISYTWTTTNGNIVGDANQQTITVDADGIYKVTVSNCKNCEASDEVEVVFNEGPEVYAGEDVAACGTLPVALTATANSTTACEGACEYPIEEMAKCDVGPTNTEEIHLSNPHDSRFYTTESRFITYADGTAQYTATASNGLDTVVVDISYSGYTTTAPQGSPKQNDCAVYDTSDWVYWTTTSGTITSELHGVFNVMATGSAFQMGVGADTRRAGFGASGWIIMTGGDGYYGVGDINLKLGECVRVAASSQIHYSWTTEDGNILGDANQKTIAVDASGTYKVTVANCADCIAMDEVVVTIISPEAGTIAAVSEEVCLSDEEVAISAIPDGNQFVPQNYTSTYILTSGEDLLVEQIAEAPEFFVTEPGKYTIHTLVYPTALDLLSAITFRETTGADLNALLATSCASLDMTGAHIMVEYLSCSKTALNNIGKVFPVPAASGSTLQLVINTETGKIGPNTDVSISLVAPQESVTISLYDINTGKLVHSSAPYQISKGKATIEYTPSQVASGVYLLKVNGIYWTDSKQIIIK